LFETVQTPHGVALSRCADLVLAHPGRVAGPAPVLGADTEAVPAEAEDR
jgi:hypothetical protein